MKKLIEEVSQKNQITKRNAVDLIKTVREEVFANDPDMADVIVKRRLNIGDEFLMDVLNFENYEG